MVSSCAPVSLFCCFAVSLFWRPSFPSPPDSHVANKSLTPPNSKEKKKKCNEERPACDRCVERGLKCEYEPIKPRKRRRTISPSEFSAPSLHLPLPPTAVNNGFHSRLQALRQDPNSGMSPISTSPTPRLNAIAEGWEIRSAYEDSTSSYGEFFSDSSLSPYDAYPPHDFRPPVDSLDMLLKDMNGSHASSASSPDMITSAPAPPCHSPFQRSASFSGTTSSGPPMAPFAHIAPSPGLLDHFCHELAPLLVFKEQNNPFLDLLLPLTSHSQVLLSAFYAVSSAHLENLGKPVDQKSLDLHSKALQGLATSIGRKDSEDEDSTLAATLLLLYYEVSSHF